MTDDLFVDELPRAFTSKENDEYFEKLKNGDATARELLIEHNIKFVAYRVLKRFYNVDYDKKELMAIGLEGLINAVDLFDVSRKTKFSSFAAVCIDNEILMFLRKIKKLSCEESFDAPIQSAPSKKELFLKDMIPDERVNIEEDYQEYDERTKRENLIRDVVVSLPTRDRLIMTLYYGFFGEDVCRQRELSDKFNLSQPSVARLIQKNLIKIKEMIEIAQRGKTTRKGKKPKSIYNLLQPYTKSEINLVIRNLTPEDYQLLHLRYGDNFNKPTTSPFWNKDTTSRFYMRLVPKMKAMLEENRKRKKSVVLRSNKDSKKNELFNEIYKHLIARDLKDVESLIQKYLETLNLLQFEKFINNLIILSIKEDDYTFIRPIYNLALLGSGYYFDIERYKDYFYESLRLDLEEAELYYEIITNLIEAQSIDISTEPLRKALEKVRKNKRSN